MSRDNGPLVLAIDQGTSSTKTSLVDEAGAVVASGAVPVTLSTPAPGVVEQSGEELWRSGCAAVDLCLEGIDPARVAAVGLSNQRESLILWERSTGRAVGPLISWQDQRTVELRAELARRGHAEEVRSRSGLPLDPMFSALKATWLLDAYDRDRRRSLAGELCLGTVDSWMLFQMNGGFHVIEVGNASRTQLLNVQECAWDDALLELFDVPSAVLPRITPSNGAFGLTKGLGSLPDGVPIAGVMGDSHAALFAQQGWEIGRVKATYGSGASTMAIAASSVSVPDTLCLTVAWDMGGPAWALEGTTRSAGSTLVWLASLLGTTPESLFEIAGRSANGGVFLVPAFNGLAAPWWDDAAVGLISGLTYATRPEHLARAALEAIAHQVEDVVVALEQEGVGVTTLLADGGPASNAALMRFQSDIGGRRIERARVQNLSAMGVAYAAGLSVGLWRREDLQHLDRPFDAYEPQMSEESRRQERAGWADALRRAGRLPHDDTADWIAAVE